VRLLEIGSYSQKSGGPMEKSLDQKLASIHADPSGSRAFIICDAKDQDMAFGIAAPGRYHSHEAPDANFPYRSVEDFRDQIRAIVRQGIVDIMLTSNSNSEMLCLEEKLYENSAVTPAVRANDTTDIHVVTGGIYPRVASRPFRSATLDQIQCGKIQCTDAERQTGPDLGLYSVTFNNDLERDIQTLEAYKTFRLEAEKAGFRHFLEVFNPNMPKAIEPEKLGRYINDMILRTLAAVPSRSRPIFLKTVYHGPRFMEELVHYDPHLIVGVLGGAAGTTFDAFDLLYQARKYGARAALFGRKINQAEHQTAFIKVLSLVAAGDLLPAEAVRAYHGVLEGLRIRPVRPLKEDLMPTVDLLEGEEQSNACVVVPDLPYCGNDAKEAVQSRSPEPNGGSRIHGAEPDFEAMTLQQKLEYNQKRRDQIFG